MTAVSEVKPLDAQRRRSAVVCSCLHCITVNFPVNLYCFVKCRKLMHVTVLWTQLSGNSSFFREQWNQTVSIVQPKSSGVLLLVERGGQLH